MVSNRAMLNLYYLIKPCIPRKFQIRARRRLSEIIKQKNGASWPILPESATIPSWWKGWKDDRKFALILTHDAEWQYGFDKCESLMEIEKNMGFVSSFNLVPERYCIDIETINRIKAQGFEVGVHGLRHDGKLLLSREMFLERSKKINEYIRKWGAAGFRAPSMHHDLELFKHLNIAYDASTFDTDPFEPQSDGVRTIFPFCVLNGSRKICYWELPYTLPQDSTLYIILREDSNAIWKKKVDWVAQNGGMALLNTHPDYMNFSGSQLGFEEYPLKFYVDFLDYVKTRYEGQYWNPRPVDLVHHLNHVYHSTFN